MVGVADKLIGKSNVVLKNTFTLYLRNTTYVPVFYRGNKIWVRVRVRMNLITSALAPERVPIIYFRDKSRVQLFYFDDARFNFYKDDFAMHKCN